MELNHTLFSNMTGIEKIQQLSSLYIVSCGLVSNGVSFIIFKRESFKKQSIGTYLSWLSIANIIVLLSLLGKVFQNLEIQWMKTNVYCSIYGYYQYVSLQYCSWILVLNSFDFMFSLRHKTQRMKKKITQIRPLVIILLVLLVINIPHLCFSKYNNSIFECDHADRNIGLLYIDIVDLFVCILIPFVLMGITTTIILVRLFKSRSEGCVQNYKRRLIRKTKFAITVIGLNLLFLIFNLPICVLLIIKDYRELKSIYSNNQSNDSQLDLFLSLSRILMYLYNSSLLIISLISNRLFRTEFFSLFKRA